MRRNGFFAFLVLTISLCSVVGCGKGEEKKAAVTKGGEAAPEVKGVLPSVKGGPVEEPRGK